MRKVGILVGMMLVIVASAFAGAGTFSYFSNTESMTGISFATGYADLKLTQCYMHKWYDTATAEELDVHFPTNLYPGYGGHWNPTSCWYEPVDGCIYLGNFGTVNITVTATITDYTENVTGLKDKVYLNIAWSGNGRGTGFHTLSWWMSHKATLFDGNPILAGEHKFIKFNLMVPSSAGNEIAHGYASFTIQFDATQAH